jgi:hypothetical protein
MEEPRKILVSCPICKFSNSVVAISEEDAKSQVQNVHQWHAQDERKVCRCDGELQAISGETRSSN